MRGGFTTLVLIAALMFGAAFASAPWFAFRALRSAAQNQDVQALGELVDYSAVRGALRSQIRPTAAAQIPAPDVWTDPIGAMRRALQQPILEKPPQVDNYLTPVALARMTDGRSPLDTKPRTGPLRLPTVIYWGFRRCRIGVDDPDQPSRRTVFTFERRGLFDWTLVQIRLPSRPVEG